jgi:hypothetical protein
MACAVVHTPVGSLANRAGGTPQNPSQSLFHLLSPVRLLKLHVALLPTLTLLHCTKRNPGPQRLPLNTMVRLETPLQVTGVLLLTVNAAICSAGTHVAAAAGGDIYTATVADGICTVRGGFGG